MSDAKIMHVHGDGDRRFGIVLPFDAEDWARQWGSLRTKMLSPSGVAPEFTRDEWAYLVSFLDPKALLSVYEQTFGPRRSAGDGVSAVYKPRGDVGVWLPNNASLLGPLTLILISLTGSGVRAKAGSRADDLASAFVRYAARMLEPCALKTYLNERVRIEQFTRDDPRNAAMAKASASRVVFGSDAAVAAIGALPHEPSSRLFGFADHRSEAWVHAGKLDDAAVLMVGRVFAIYGRAGCTSPARVIVMDGTLDDCRTLRERLLSQWKRIMPTAPAMHHASQNVMSWQLARAQGWDAERAPGNSAVIMVGEHALPEIPGHWALPIMPASLDQTISTLAPNIQTVGHLLSDAHSGDILARVAATPIKRYVPLAQMHHFGPVWDGWDFWRELFEVVQIG